MNRLGETQNLDIGKTYFKMSIVYCNYKSYGFLFYFKVANVWKCKTHRHKVIHKKISISNHNLFVVGVQKPTRLILSCNSKILYENLCQKKIY